MKTKSLRVFLAAVLAFSCLPVSAFAEDYDTSDAGSNSFRMTDGVPNNVLYEEAEQAQEAAAEQGDINLQGAFADVPDDFRSTWSAENGVSTYTYRKTPKGESQIINVPGSREVGVDVSYYNNENGGKYREIDWEEVLNDGVTFAIVRAADAGVTGKGFLDPWFVNNIKGAKKAGLKVGVYIYSRAKTLTGATFSVDNEIKFVRTQLEAAGMGPKDLALPIYLDMEDSSQRGVDKVKLGSIAKKFCDAFQAEGYKVGIYANQEWFNYVLTHNYFQPATMQANGWSRWVARYSWGSSASGVVATDMWQFTSIGMVNGMPRKYCDMNFLYADMGAVPKRYKITYKLNGGTNNAMNPATYVNHVDLLNPTRTGYEFDGWYTDATFTNKVTELSGTGAKTVYAKWTQPYQITYKLNGGKNHADNLARYGGTFTLKSPTKSGYAFMGWYTDSAFTKKVTKVSKDDFTLYAKWVKQYKITYKLNGGKNSSANPAKAGGTVTLKSPYRSGYRFIGWYLNKSFTKRVTSLSMTKNRTVYARWKKFTKGTYRVATSSGLNVRETASTSARVVKVLRPGTKCKIVKVSKEWGKLSSGHGWINLDYTVKI